VLLGKQMTAAEADPYIRGLGLEPYYVILSRNVLMGQTLPVPTGSQTRDPVTDALLKQLGVASVRDIPSGDYVVPIQDANGTTRTAHVKVSNVGGRTRISVSITDNGN
jgi:hypothetical protein